MNSTSKILLSVETISELSQVSLGQSAVSAEELPDGWFNTIYRVELEGGTTGVLKMSPPPALRVMRYERNLLRAEIDVLRLLQDVEGVPVPRVLGADLSRTTHDHDYFFMEFVDGDPYNTVRDDMPAGQRAAIDTKLAAISERINSERGTTFGRFLHDHCGADAWPTTVFAMVDDLLADAADMGVSLPVSPSQIRAAYRNAESELSQVAEPRLVVWDLHPGNVFVQGDRVTGIIDCDRALWGDPFMEFFFRTIARSTQAFFHGYPGHETLRQRPGAARCLWLYDLYLDLIMIIECSFRGYESSHRAWAEESFNGTLQRADPGWT